MRDLVENLNWGSRSSRTILGLRFWRFDTCLDRVLLTLFTRVNDQPENACENKYGHNEWENNACIHDFTPYSAPEMFRTLSICLDGRSSVHKLTRVQNKPLIDC